MDVIPFCIVGLVLLFLFALHVYDAAKNSVEYEKGCLSVWDLHPEPGQDCLRCTAFFGFVSFGLAGVMVGTYLGEPGWVWVVCALIGAVVGAWVGSIGLILTTRAIVRLFYPGTTFQEGRSRAIARLGLKRTFHFGWIENLL